MTKEQINERIEALYQEIEDNLEENRFNGYEIERLGELLREMPNED